jgi:hypothetical protein
MNVNLIYDNSGPRTPTGATANQPLASFDNIGIRSYRTEYNRQPAPANNKAAASVIQSNGEMIGNAQLPDNPLPPGITI